MPPEAKAQEKVVFDVAFEGLYLKGLGGRIPPGLKQRLKAEGLDLDQKLKATYPRDVWARCLRLTAAELHPTLSREDAFRRMGHVVLEGTANTLIGKTIASMAKLIGPRRALGRLKDAYASLNNFVTCKVTELSPNVHELWVSDCYGIPSYMQGGLEAALALAGAKGLQVEPLSADGDAVTYKISWQADR